MELFRHKARKEGRGQPLAMRMRPRTLEGFFGQEHLVGEDKLLGRVLATDRVPSLILWGPPGSGKTTLARVLAQRTGAQFQTLSAVGSGVKDLRAAVERAAEARDVYGKRTILFIDEIHRFNKAQQDALLPHVEEGTVVLIGATTENPSFEVISALLSRMRVLRLEKLPQEALCKIMRRALQEDAQLKAAKVEVNDEHLETIAHASHGDARRALTSLEVVVSLAMEGEAISTELVEQALQGKTLLYDRAGDEHYNVVSAFIKSMRGSDPHAAVYWMTRMLEAGEDPRFVLRRLVIFASEDIGNADPQALSVAVSALSAFELVGMPEGSLPLTQAVTYLACAPKSNAVLTTYARARRDVREQGPLGVPMHLRNAPTKLMRETGHGVGYRYPHDFEGNYVPERYLPDELAGRSYYRPSGNGFEGELKARLEAWEEALREVEQGGEAPQKVRDSHPPLDD